MITKGKWVYEKSKSGCTHIYNEDFSPIAEIYARQDTEANAKLIAAAPDLLGALEKIANHYDQDGYGVGAWKELALEMARRLEQMSREGRFKVHERGIISDMLGIKADG